MNCANCGLAFTKLYEYNIHKKKHAYQCQLCDEDCATEQILIQHVYVHVQIIRFCETCKIVILNKEYYVFHMQGHVEKSIKTYSCESCNRTFVYQRSYIVHRTTCANQAIDLSCDFCSAKPFKRKCDTMRHVKKHTSEQSFKCNVCCKGFTRKSYLMTHLRNHGLYVEGQVESVDSMNVERCTSSLNSEIESQK